MRSLRALLLLGVLATAGCVVESVFPMVDDASAAYDARLLGTWREPDDEGTAVVSRADSSSYLILYIDREGRTGRFRGRLGRIGTQAVLDVQPDDSSLAVSDAYRGLLLPLHTIFFVDSLGTELHLRALQPDSLDHFLRRDSQAVAHLRIDGTVVLTAPTPELQRFLAAFAARPGVLQQSAVWVR